MCVLIDKMKKSVRLCVLSFLVFVACAGVCGAAEEASIVFASEQQAETEDETPVGDAQMTEEAEDSEVQSAETGSETGDDISKKQEEEEPPFNAKEKFVIFTCCLFSVAFCVIVGLYGNPNDRLKDKYKRARKQQMLQEKKKKETAARAAKRAAQEAEYAEALAQYEADVKAYEEAKAAKAAAKAAKKAEKEAKKK